MMPRPTAKGVPDDHRRNASKQRGLRVRGREERARSAPVDADGRRGRSAQLPASQGPCRGGTRATRRWVRKIPPSEGASVDVVLLDDAAEGAPILVGVTGRARDVAAVLAQQVF